MGVPEPAAASQEEPAAARVAIVGIGEDGWEGLGPEARRRVREAGVLVGGKRHLALVPASSAERIAWAGDIAGLVDDLLQTRAGPLVVLASGDPMLYGVGALIARRVPAHALRIVPTISSPALAAARLGWPLHEVRIVSACGRPLETLHAELFDGARVLLLSADGGTPGLAADLLVARGFGESALWVLEHLGGERERVLESTAAALPRAPFAALNLVAIEMRMGSGARAFTPAPGLPDDAYESDGQLTKRETRAATLARLSPRPGELLWDVGAGSGSIGIEWMRAAPRARALAIEERGERAARARRNAAALGVPGLVVLEGRAPAALDALERPDAVFIGGGLSDEGVFEAAWEALKAGGRLVANVVSLESEARLLDLWSRHGGELVRLSVARAEPVGTMSGWRPLMPVTQWAVEKPRA